NAPANASPAAPLQPSGNAPQDQQIYPSNLVTPGISPSGVLAGTPFEAAPTGVQRNVILSAQIALARRGLYHEEIGGVFGKAMEFSLRAYQARDRKSTRLNSSHSQISYAVFCLKKKKKKQSKSNKKNKPRTQPSNIDQTTHRSDPTKRGSSSNAVPSLAPRIACRSSHTTNNTVR